MEAKSDRAQRVVDLLAQAGFDATLSENVRYGDLRRPALLDVHGTAALLAALDSGAMNVDGAKALFRRFVESLDEFDPMFNVVEP